MRGVTKHSLLGIVADLLPPEEALSPTRSGFSYSGMMRE